MTETSTGLCRFSIDRGGTFTDVYAEIPGEPGFQVVKLLSEDPQNYPDAPREGIRRILEKVTGKSLAKDAFHADQIEWVRMGTTVATNALLERKGARSVLVTTKGFRDLLQIGNQSRPVIFDLVIKKPDLLYESIIEIDERVRFPGPDEAPGNRKIVKGITDEELIILAEPNEDKIRKELQIVFDQGIRSIAVVLMHAYTFIDHELVIGKIAQEIGFTQISLSHQVMPMVKMVARGDTTTVDAYLTPHIQNYLESFRSGFTDRLKQTPLLFMQSDGGLISADQFKGSNAILSGPAGGVVGYAMTTYQQMANQAVIGFDMGGTSTDVSRYGGEYELVHETETAGVRIQAPQMNIRTVAAGGGSRLFFRNDMFEVGPESAGAHPGPVCYRKNGHLAITDANLLLGRLQSGYFPKIFGKNEDEALDIDGCKAAFDQLSKQINKTYQVKGHAELSTEEVALGFIKVANQVMVRPIREVSVMRGYDIKEHVLACFGGAGGQHACAIARELGITKIFIHRFAGILSAYGMGLADVVVEQQEPSANTYHQNSWPLIEGRLEKLSIQAKQQLVKQGHPADQIELQRYLNLRYDGTDTAMMILQPPDLDYEKAFRAVYLREFGFDLVDRDILVDDIRVRASAKSPGLNNILIPVKNEPSKPVDYTQCYFEGGWQQTAIYQLEMIGATQQIDGPAIIMQDTSTILIEPDCRAEITDTGDVAIEVMEQKEKGKLSIEVDPVQLSIFSNLFMSIAEQMGRTLQRTSISTNIKERLDFSCAIFDQQGYLVANAPHQPVHLGSMGEAVRNQIEILGDDLLEGDVLVSNHPDAGGSHLPDITVISPVWKDKKPIFYVASRGHHADIGGISPGSMPPFSKTLEDEGACITSFKLVEKGLFNEEGITELLMAPEKIKRQKGDLPVSGTRILTDNISDLKAQVASNQRGIDLLSEMVDHYSLEVVQAYMRHIMINAEEAVRGMLKDLSTSWNLKEVDSVEAVDYLDDGSPIRLKLTIDRRDGSATFDFAGTGKELWGNLNAPKTVTYSAIIYALRCLLEKEIPLNQGCLNPITIILEQGSLLSPGESAAVVGGNVLTSQRVTDVVFKAFKAVAGSQGCMNNFTFGNEHFGYYETIGGGAGAGKNWHGQSGVHTHMTNTRITDPEILEKRYPIMLCEFSIRPESGGKGEYQGGNGLIRELEFLDCLNVAILSERRVFAPYGLEGGECGARGENIFIRKDGRQINLGGKNEIKAIPGDRFRIKTPGGGGYGSP
jgi:5-oxoprolinase (ATP-hydrolysing)